MARNYRKYTDEDIVTAAKESTSMCQLLARLGLRAAGGNYNCMRRSLQKLSIDCSHWTGSAWSKGKQLKDWSDYTRVERLKPHLIKQRGHQCERCKNYLWQNVLIPLEVEHKNGDKTDNTNDNLELLCCNCHALTPTWRGRKNKKMIKIKILRSTNATAGYVGQAYEGEDLGAGIKCFSKSVTSGEDLSVIPVDEDLCFKNKKPGERFRFYIPGDESITSKNGRKHYWSILFSDIEQVI